MKSESQNSSDNSYSKVDVNEQDLFEIKKLIDDVRFLFDEVTELIKGIKGIPNNFQNGAQLSKNTVEVCERFGVIKKESSDDFDYKSDLINGHSTKRLVDNDVNEESIKRQEVDRKNNNVKTKEVGQVQERKNQIRLTREEINKFRHRVARRLQQCMKEELETPVINEIETLIQCYFINKLPTNHKTSYHLNEMSTLALTMAEIFQAERWVFFDKFFEFLKPLIYQIVEACERPVKAVDNKQRPETQASNLLECFHPAFLQHFWPVEVPGDGNCLWHSMSYNLFGDQSMSESLRLLTAATFYQHKSHFQTLLTDQYTKFGYKHELTFNDLITAALSPGIWGDEFHIIALSVALHRPVYCFGNFKPILDHNNNVTYKAIKRYCQNLDLINQFRFVGYERDEGNEPVCVFYDGDSHYNPLLPVAFRLPNGSWFREEPIKPKTQLIGYLFKDARKQLLNQKEITKL